MTLTMTNEELRSYIPNVVHEVEGEALLVDKMKPWLDSAVHWLTDIIIGEDYQLTEKQEGFAKKIIVAKAFAEAIPSLDLALTPSGFAVINGDGRAPASKERIERLIESLRASVDALLTPFLSMLLTYKEWRDTPMGNYWLDTFLVGLDDAQALMRGTDLLTTYRSMRESALMFQRELEHKYLGKNLLTYLRGAIHDREASHDARNFWFAIHRAEIRYITFHSSDQKAKCPDEHEVWHLVEPLLRELKYCSELYEIWEPEMGEYFKVEPFKNTRKGGYFF